MNRPSRLSLAAALALGAAAGLVTGAGLPRTQARPAVAGGAMDARLTRLEIRVGALETQVRGLQAHLPRSAPGGRGFSVPSPVPRFGSPAPVRPRDSNIPPYREVPLGR